jgi:hypothetical protein
MRKRYALILGALLLFFCPISACMPQVAAQVDFSSIFDDTDGVQVPIPMNCRVPNRSGSQCVWCSIECLSKYHKIETTSHLTDKYKHATGGGEVRRVLDSLGVKYTMQSEGNRDTQMLEDACAKGWGAGVGLNGTHMVNIVHFKGDVVKVIDNSDPGLGIRTWSKDQFLNRWDGWVIVMIPPGPPGGQTPGQNLPLAPRPPSSIK